jgi:hypothetical protein
MAQSPTAGEVLQQQDAYEPQSIVKKPTCPLESSNKLTYSMDRFALKNRGDISALAQGAAVQTC